jgi:hypothetical protein
MNLVYLALATAALWLLALTITTLVTQRFFKRLVKGAKDLDLRAVLEKIRVDQEANKESIKILSREIGRVTEEGQLHMQKVALVRFNPFKEIGGDHSFSLALLDGTDTGVIITGLHTRERTRVYMKAIKNGRCEFVLSEEEKKALAKAQKG